MFESFCCLVKQTQALLAHLSLSSSSPTRQVRISLRFYDEWFRLPSSYSANKIKQAHKLSFLISFDKLCEDLDIVFLLGSQSQFLWCDEKLCRDKGGDARRREAGKQARFGKLNFCERLKTISSQSLASCRMTSRRASHHGFQGNLKSSSLTFSFFRFVN